jgi:hypothetical protein
VYLAGPYRAPSHVEIDANIIRARTFLRVLVRKGYDVICPHTMTGQGERWAPEISEERWLELGLGLLSRCDFIYVMPGSKDSAGTQAEIAFAEKRGIKRLDG